jgi:hypothetical protein
VSSFHDAEEDGSSLSCVVVGAAVGCTLIRTDAIIIIVGGGLFMRDGESIFNIIIGCGVFELSTYSSTIITGRRMF